MITSKFIVKLRKAAVLAAFALSALLANAQTLDIYVDPTTWAYDSRDVSLFGYTTFHNFAVTSGSETRYYYGGYFDVVNVRNKNTFTIITTISPCNNICYISGTNLYALTAGFNGSGNGVSGPIAKAKVFSNGDLYIGGSFWLAGGYSHANKFSCYRFSSGWSGVNEVEVTGGDVTDLSFVGYKLQVSGTFTAVHGPTTSGSGIFNTFSAPGVAYWNEWHQSFPDSYWSSN